MSSKLIEELLEEHRIIERLLASLLRVTARAAVGDNITKSVIGQHVQSFRLLLDSLHHGREEDILFASLVAMGMPRRQGPVGVMLNEHQLGREFVGRLSDIAESPGTLTQPQRGELTEAAAAFAELLSAHIAKEDGVLYPMALSRLDVVTLSRIDLAAARWEQTLSGEREQLLTIATQLCQSTLTAANRCDERRLAAS